MQKSYSRTALAALAAIVAALLSAAATGQAQTGTTPSDTLLIRGVAADAKGPLIGKLLIVMPIDLAEGKPVTLQSGAHATLRMDGRKAPGADKWTYTYTIIGDPGLGARLNPETTTDAKGAFSINVRRDLLKRYKAGEIALGIFDGLVSSFEPEIIKYDASAPAIDVGTLVFKPVREPK